MILIPYPSNIKENEGTFCISGMTELFLDASCDYTDLESVLSLRNEIERATGFRLAITKGKYSKYIAKAGSGAGIIVIKKTGVSAAYTLKIVEGTTIISGNDAGGLFYGVQTMKQLVRNFATRIPCMEIEDQPSFEARGLFHDVTRGKVPTLETLKALTDRLSFYKINQLQLYVEHSFAFKKYSEVWTDSDPLSPEEILILDEYCNKRGVELVPALSVFGHLYQVLSSETFKHLNEFENVQEKPFLWTDRLAHYTLDASDPNSLGFAKEITDEFIPLFTSDKFNICCDETYDLGLGKNKALMAEIGKGKLFFYFVNNLIEHLKTRKRKVMMWGDILIKYPEIIPELPDDVIILNSNYDPKASDEAFKKISDAGLQQYACPGVHGWNRLINDMDNATKNISILVEHAKKFGAQGILNTDWGDFGHINLLACSIPSAIYGAGLSWNSDQPNNPTDEEISMLEYGDKTERLVGLVRELSRQPLMEWNTVVLWYYTICGHDIGIYSKFYAQSKKLMMSYDESKIKTAYTEIREIEENISALYQAVYEDRKIDVAEFLVAADGLALFQALLLVIKKKYFDQTTTGLIYKPSELAIKLEYWFTSYKSVWRKRNKESELFRIKDVIMGICKLLRSAD